MLSTLRRPGRDGTAALVPVAVRELPVPGVGDRRDDVAPRTHTPLHPPELFEPFRQGRRDDVAPRTHTPLHLWFWAAHLMTTATPGISAVQLARQLGIVSYETAWMMQHNLRRAMVNPEQAPLTGAVRSTNASSRPATWPSCGADACTA